MAISIVDSIQQRPDSVRRVVTSGDGETGHGVLLSASQIGSQI
jgi:hypothetical protein